MRRTRHSVDSMPENSPNRGKEQARRGMVDVLQSNGRVSLRARENRPSYADPNSSDEDVFEEVVNAPTSNRHRKEGSRAVAEDIPEVESHGRSTRSSRHSSRLEEFEEETNIEDDRASRRSSRSRGGDSLSFAVTDSGRSRRRSARAEEDVEEEVEQEIESNQRYPRRHSSRYARNDAEISEEEEAPRRYSRRSRSDQPEEDNEDVDDELEEEEEEQKKYPLRDRAQHKRETLNVSHLGGDGQSYLKSTKSRHNLREREKDSQHSIYREHPRVYLGGKIPTGGRDREKRHRRHHDRHKRRHFDSSSDSSDGSDRDYDRRKRSRGGGHQRGDFDGEDRQFREHEEERVRREMASIVPISLADAGGGRGMGGSVLDKASRRDIARADVTPIAVDPSVGFASVGGLDKHVRALKEMVVLPLLYPDVFQRFDTQPPRGVLFVGPPGTGKTLTARALANSLCAGGASGGQGGIGGRKVSFFMRKGADCLSKWVGEGERQLRLLFEQAKLYEPSIIFFDEIDGLAPVRSIKQDQIHASIVSTLLALMDGLDSRGQVVVIGATNRPDAIDPALRRPGRFDRELMFPLPDASARRAILDIHTASWQPPLDESIKQWIVESSGGYCGADMKALCSEAAIISLRRAYPQVYSSNSRLELDPSTLVLSRGDFAAAFSKVIPASRRSSGTPARALEGLSAPLLSKHVEEAYARACEVFAPADKEVSAKRGQEGEGVAESEYMMNSCEEEWIATLTDVQERDSAFDASSDTKNAKSCSGLWDPSSITSRPRVMIRGLRGMSHGDVAAALLQKLESFQVINIDISSLLADGAYISAEQALVSRIQEARRASPCVIYLPDIIGWWRAASDTLRTVLASQIDAIPVNLPVLWVSSLILEKGHTQPNPEQRARSQSLSESAPEPACVDSSGRVSKSPNDSDVMDCLDIFAEDSPGGTGENYANLRRFASDEKLLHVISFLSGTEGVDVQSTNGEEPKPNEILSRMSRSVVDLSVPTQSERTEFFSQYFQSLSVLPATLYNARKSIYDSRSQVLKVAQVTSAEGTEEGVGVRGAAAALADVNEERDKNYMREQRVFFRAALSELLKEKRFQSLWRPVDPEQVPDYFDIITAPMDLETMRSKVDENLYPTYKFFLYDIEQIIFNAKEYNPLNSKDSRGRSIVSAAHNMLDVVETHAYGFKQRLGYDVFQRCEEVCLRRGMERWRLEPSTENRSIMPEENKIFYAAVLRVHNEVKKELGLVDPPQLSQNLSTSSSAVMPDTHEEHIAPEARIGEEEAEVTDKREMRRLSRERAAEATQEARSTETFSVKDQQASEEGLASGDDCDGIADQADSEVCPKAPRAFFDDCPVSNKLKEQMILAAEMNANGWFLKMSSKTVTKTDGWTVAELLSLYSGLNRCSRKFQSNHNWQGTIKEIEQTLNEVS